MNLNTIKTLSVRGESSGLDKLANELTAVGRAHTRVADAAEGTATVTEAAARRQLSAARAYDGVRARVDQAYQSQLRYIKDAQTVERAFSQGLVGAAEYARTLDMVAQKYGVVSAAAERYKRDMEQAAAVQTRVNSITGVSGGSDYGQRGADIAAYGRQLDDLRAKYNPLYAAGRQYKETLAEINQAAKVGAISEKERAAAIMDTKVAFVQQTNSLRGVNDAFQQSGQGAQQLSKGVGLARHEMVNLSRQAQDIVVSLQGGQGFGTVMLQQGSQVIDVFANSAGTIKGFFGQIGSSLTSIITPARLAFGGIVTGAGAAVLAVNSYLDSQKEVQRSLAGIGRASGLTVGGVNAVASAGASPLGFSVAEAREFASAMVSTGRIGRDELTALVKLGHDFSKVLGVTGKEAAQTLAGALSDPVRGADQLNQRLGFMDAAQRRNIQNLVEQNRIAEAQRVIIAGIQSSIESVSSATGFWSKTWTAIANAVSNTWDGLGNVLARATGVGQSLDDQYATAKARLLELQKIREAQSGDDAFSAAARRVRGGVISDDSAKYNEAVANEQRLAKALQDRAAAADATRQRMASLQIASTAMDFLPEIRQLDQLKNAQDLLVRTMVDVQVSGGPASEILKRIGLTYEQLAAAIAKANAEIKDFASQNQRAAAQAKIAQDAVTAYSPGARADIARRQAVESNRGNPEAEARGQEAYTLALRQANEAIREQARERQLASDQAVQSARLELELVGKGIGAQTESRLNLQARHQLEQEAARNRTAFDNAEFERLKRNNAEIAQATRLRALADVRSNIDFQQKTAFLSQEDVQIAQQLKEIFQNDIPAALNSSEAAQLRALNNVRAAIDIASSHVSSLARDIANGVEPMEALAKQASRLAESLIDIGARQLVTSIAGSLFGDATTGATQASAILTSAGTTLGAQIVASAAQAAGILSGGGTAAGAALGAGGTVAGTTVATGGTTAGAGIAAGGLAASLGLTGAAASLAAALGPIALIGVGIGALFGFGGGGDKKRREEEQRRLQEGFDREEAFWKLQDRQAATRDPRGLAGDLAKFDREAQWQRLEESKKGNHNLIMLEQTLAMERLKVVEDYNAEVLERQQSFQDRVFAATNDSDTLAGAIAEFERNAARERAEEVRAGGEAMADLEAALAAERLGILRSFAEKAADTERQAIEAANAVAQQQVQDAQAAVDQARSALSDAYEREASVIKGVIDRTTQFLQTLSKFKDDLVLNRDLSVLSDQARYEEARRQLYETASLAQGGNETAQGELTGKMEAFLRESQNMNASTEAYYRDFTEVQNILSQTEQLTRNQLSQAQQEMQRLDMMVAGFGVLNASTLSVRDAVVALSSALANLSQAQAQLPQTPTQPQYSATVTDLYSRVLNRAPDAVGAAYWQTKIDAGIDYDLLIRQFISGALANGQSVNAAIRAQYGMATGGMVTGGMPGLDSVWKLLMPDEGVLNRGAVRGIGGAPAVDFINQTGRLPGNDNRELVAEMRQANARLAKIEDAVWGSGKNVRDGIDQQSDTQKQSAASARQSGNVPKRYGTKAA